ncbi:MAG: hypothetical protein HZA93_29355 [Verrucomicrobia bacterium]|nr:hypothetical protein [Verrucomicrobiota bacterium]
MPNAENFEERLLIATDAFAALIAADAYFATAPAVPVLTERTGDINQTIAQALAKLGLCVVVVAADGDSLVRSGNGLSLRVRLVAQISELYLINQGATGTHKPALAAATRVMKAVDRQPNGLDVGRHLAGLNEFLLPEEQPFKLTKDARYVVYQVTAFTTIEL